MKKFMSIFVVLTLVLILVSCGGNSNKTTDTEKDSVKIEETKEVEETKIIDDKKVEEKKVVEKEIVEEKEVVEQVEIVEPATETTEGKPLEKELFVDTKTVVFETNLGTFELDLWVGKAPIAAGNMVDKAKSGFYNGLIFHRIIDGFMIQGGDPQGTGMGGGNMDVDPVFPGSSNVRGTIAMASSTTGQPMAYQSDAQFFINHGDNTFLDNSGFIAFGEVSAGMDIVDKIASVETKMSGSGEKSTPVNPVTLIKVYVK